MNINFKQAAGILMFLACLVYCLPSGAQTKPLWAQKGEKSLNKKRSNEHYEFKVFNTYGMDEGKLKSERLQPLIAYVCELYGISSSEIQTDSFRTVVSPVTNYRLRFSDNGSESVVYARRIDEYSVYEDYVDNTFQFEYYQLYTISEKNATLDVFDDCETTRFYNSNAAFKSIIPGLGQIYKGQKAKGYTIMGAEAALVASIIVFESKRHYCKNQIGKHEGIVADSWRSKTTGWRTMRNISIGLAGGLYVYNLIDAAVSKGARQVIVRKQTGQQLTVAPMTSADGAGLSFALQF